MADQTKIEWTDATWNPITGCSVTSPGCTNCYAMKLAGTRLAHHPSRAGLTQGSKTGPVWNGEVRLNEQWLDQPLRWKRPRRIFVCAHGDLFHESVPDKWIDHVFAVMALAPQHTFQVLTKRSERMCTYINQIAGECRHDAYAFASGKIANFVNEILGRSGFSCSPDWPLPNVWLGVSAEDQSRANERVPVVLSTPAAKRFISAEPLLSEITLQPEWLAKLDWVIVGGESGSSARPMNIDWVRSLRNQCQNAGVAFHFKQWGEWLPIEDRLQCGFNPWEIIGHLEQRNGSFRAGKRASGRLLDGREWSEFPA